MYIHWSETFSDLPSRLVARLPSLWVFDKIQHITHKRIPPAAWGESWAHLFNNTSGQTRLTIILLFFFFLSLFLAKKEMFRQFIWFLRGRVTCVETSFCYGFLTALFSPSRDDGAVKLWITTELVKLFLLLLLLFLPTFHPDSINLGVGMYT